jgi:hypothetical protein
LCRASIFFFFGHGRHDWPHIISPEPLEMWHHKQSDIVKHLEHNLTQLWRQDQSRNYSSSSRCAPTNRELLDAC